MRVAPSGQTSLFSSQCACPCRLSMPLPLCPLAAIMWGLMPPTPPSHAPAQRGQEERAVGLPPFFSAFPSCPHRAGRAVATRHFWSGGCGGAPPSRPLSPRAPLSQKLLRQGDNIFYLRYQISPLVVGVILSVVIPSHPNQIYKQPLPIIFPYHIYKYKQPLGRNI